MTMSLWEIAANVFNALSIFLAGRNRVHTWWTGIVGCLLFCQVFYVARLYADLTLQIFFVASSALGWWNWRRARDPQEKELPVRRTPLRWLTLLALAAVLVAIGYGFLLRSFTQAAAPFVDSVVLAFSVLGQFLLMGRRIESWWCWILVNAIGLPLYISRGLFLTAFLSPCFLVNAVVALLQWRKLLPDEHEAV